MIYETPMTQNADHANADFLNSLDEAWHDEIYQPVPYLLKLVDYRERVARFNDEDAT